MIRNSFPLKNFIKAIVIMMFILPPDNVLYAQTNGIIGVVQDESGRGIEGANAVVLNENDSTVLGGSTTDHEGVFRIGGLKKGRHLLRITFMGYEDVFQHIELSGRLLNTGKIILKEKALIMKEVEISRELIPVQQRGDTIEYNAEAFRTATDASIRDLVTKLPGITVKDGNVQAQGEEVKKVKIDGKEFFGDNVNAVLNNLPAALVDKIQVYDEKSEQSKLTGFEDGNTEKTMNVVTKKEYRNGIFGRATAGYGIYDKWLGRLTFNIFNDSRRISIFVNSNNLNEQSYAMEDDVGVLASSFGSGRAVRIFRSAGGSGMAGFSGISGSGINITHSLGLYYTNEWKKLNLSGSYFINLSENISKSDLLRQYYTGQIKELNYLESSQSTSEGISHRFDFKLEWKIDTMKNFIIQPRLSFQENSITRQLLGENSSLSTLINSTKNNNSSDFTGMFFSTTFFYSQRFRKKGRSFSIYLTPSTNQNKGKNLHKSYSLFYEDIVFGDTLDQKAYTGLSGSSVSSSIVYTEPISENSHLLLNLRNSFRNANSEKETYNYAVIDKSYDLFDSSLSNNYESQFQSHSFGLTYRYTKDKWHLNSGMSFQYALLRGVQISPHSFNLSKGFTSVLPNLSFHYRFSRNKSLRIMFSGTNNTPAVSQLQDVINNDNPLQLRTGNPELEQDSRKMLYMIYSANNTDKKTHLYFSLSSTYIQNYVVNSSFIALKDTMIAPGILMAKGSQISKPVNLDGFYSVRSYSSFSFHVKKIKSNIGLNTGGSFSRTPALINDDKSFSSTVNVSCGLSLSSNISEYFDFIFFTNNNFSKVSNSLHERLNTDYFNQDFGLKLNIMPSERMVLQTNLSHQSYYGLAGQNNQNFLLWNAAFAYKFLKNNAGELRLSVFDIMKQNKSISRNITEAYYEDLQQNVLEQYFLLSFTYNFRRFKVGESDENHEQKGGIREFLIY